MVAKPTLLTLRSNCENKMLRIGVFINISLGCSVTMGAGYPSRGTLDTWDESDKSPKPAS